MDNGDMVVVICVGRGNQYRGEHPAMMNVSVVVMRGVVVRESAAKRNDIGSKPGPSRWIMMVVHYQF